MTKEELNGDLSPCIGVCQYNDDELCQGCFRTSKEITQWLDLSLKEKKKIINLIPIRIKEFS